MYVLSIKPYTDVDDALDENPSSSTSASGPSHDDDTGIPSHYPGIIEDVEGVEQIQQYDIELFEQRFDNGYDIYDDLSYLDCLRKEHPDSLPGSKHLDVRVN